MSAAGGGVRLASVADGAPPGAARAGARFAHGAEPAWFAMVMATGIVSAALRQDAWPGPAQALLGAAAVCFVMIAVAVGWRVRHDLAGLPEHRIAAPARRRMALRQHR